MSESGAEFALYVDVLRTLDAAGARYAIIGAFAASIYGITRMTHDIDIVVDLRESDVQALVARFPPPRYYADPQQMRDSMRLGIMFNIIDGDEGVKADLLPMTMHSDYRHVLARRLRLPTEMPGEESLEAWFATPADVIIGKLRAWREGRSRKHETDIYEMLVFHDLGLDPELGIDEQAVGKAAMSLGADVQEFWRSVRETARREAERLAGHSEPS